MNGNVDKWKRWVYRRFIPDTFERRVEITKKRLRATYFPPAWKLLNVCLLASQKSVSDITTHTFSANTRFLFLLNFITKVILKVQHREFYIESKKLYILSLIGTWMFIRHISRVRTRRSFRNSFQYLLAGTTVIVYLLATVPNLTRNYTKV